MIFNSGLKTFICWFFISTLFISALQVTVAGYQADKNSWFSIITLILAEEENEESESEEKEGKESVKDWFANCELDKFAWSYKYLGSDFQFEHYQSVMREVVSPPPEAS